MNQCLAALFLIFFTFSAGATLQCRSLIAPPTSQEFLQELNEKYAQRFFTNTPQEKFKSSFYLTQKYKLFRLKRMLRNLEKNAKGFDDYDLNKFVYKLDRLAFADTVANDPLSGRKYTRSELTAVADARRTLLADGIIKYFGIDTTRSTLWKKSMHVLGQAVSWKYWRWSQAAFYMPKLMGKSLPPELAEKILLEGLDRHRAEVERYIPAIRGRAYFNQFSRFYNTTVLVALFTVVPYMTHNYYVAQMQAGERNAVTMMAPLVETSDQMARTNFLEQREQGALEKYAEAYTEKYGVEPTTEQLEEVRVVIHEKIMSENRNVSAVTRPARTAS